MNVDMEDNRARLPRYFTLEMLMSVMVALSGLVLIWNLGIARRQRVGAVHRWHGVHPGSSPCSSACSWTPTPCARANPATCCSWPARPLTAMGEEGYGQQIRPAHLPACFCPPPRPSPWRLPTIDFILGYAGYEESHNLSGSVIRTHATYSTLADGKTRVLFTPEEIGFPTGTHAPSNAAIIVPLVVGTHGGGHAQVLLPPCQPHQRDAEVHRRRASASCCPRRWRHRRSRSRRALATKHGAEDAPKPDQPALPVQHHQHHRLAHRAPTPIRARTLLREFAEVLPQHA